MEILRHVRQTILDQVNSECITQLLTPDPKQGTRR